MFVVYVLKSKKDGRRYVGVTVDLPRRVKAHNNGRVRSTAPKRPFTLVTMFLVNTKHEAIRLERYLKTGAGRRKLKAWIRDQ